MTEVLVMACSIQPYQIIQKLTRDDLKRLYSDLVNPLPEVAFCLVCRNARSLSAGFSSNLGNF